MVMSPQTCYTFVHGHEPAGKRTHRCTMCCRIVSGWTNEQVIRDTVFVGFNTSDSYAITTCCHCNFPNSKNQGAKTTHFERVNFIDCPHRVKYAKPKRAIIHDVDGSLGSGPPGWHCHFAHALMLQLPARTHGAVVVQLLVHARSSSMQLT
jgi:hypothetical protein